MPAIFLAPIAAKHAEDDGSGCSGELKACESIYFAENGGDAEEGYTCVHQKTE